MAEHGFAVTSEPYLGLATAFRAEFTYGSAHSGRTLGVNAEMKFRNFESPNNFIRWSLYYLVQSAGCRVDAEVKRA